MTVYEGLVIQEVSPYGIVAQEGGKIYVFDMGENTYGFVRPAVGMDSVSSPYLGTIPYAQSDEAVPVVGGRIYDWLYLNAFTSSSPKYRLAQERSVAHRYMFLSVKANANFRDGCYLWGFAYNKEVTNE